MLIVVHAIVFEPDRIAAALIASCYCLGTGQSTVVGGDFVVENVDQIEALLEPALIVVEREKRLEFLDGETIAIEI